MVYDHKYWRIYKSNNYMMADNGQSQTHIRCEINKNFKGDMKYYNQADVSSCV